MRERPGGPSRNLVALLKLDLGKPAPADLTALFPEPVERIRLEIGFGGGEHLIHRAAGRPGDRLLSGWSPSSIRWRSCSGRSRRRHQEHPPSTMTTRRRCWIGCPAASVDQIDLLYPDPWPKRKHWKPGVFVSAVNLDRFARILKPGGVFLLCLGHRQLYQLDAHPLPRPRGFRMDGGDQRADWLTPFAGWPSTRYEAKARREGRQFGLSDLSRR